MVYLDTNALIRFFTNDDPEKALKVKTLLETEKEISIPEVVFPEIEYVLQGLYNTSRREIVKIFKFLISQSNIKLGKAVKRAVTLFEKTNFDMADCIILAESLKGKLASFDRNLLKTPEIKSYW